VLCSSRNYSRESRYSQYTHSTEVTISCSSVVRFGPSEDNVSTKLLQNAVVSYFEKQTTDNTPPSAASTAINNQTGCTFTISNKYFHAKVLLEEIGGPSLEKSQEDGIILVFDTLQSNPDRSNSNAGHGHDGCHRGGATFDSLSFAHKQAEEKNSCGDLLRLFVGVSLTSLSPEELRGTNSKKEYSRQILWCLDQGYEYVEADMSQDGQSKGHNERDKEGFARIIEAIQGTVWSSPVMKTAKTKELKQSYTEESPTLQNDQKEENPYEPPNPSKFGLLQLTEDDSRKEDRLLMDDEDAAATLLLEPNKVGPEEMAEIRNDLETEKIFDDIEGVLKEVARIGEQSKSGMLTDNE
jgi:hypothetical protein